MATVEEMTPELIAERNRNAHTQKIYKPGVYKAQADEHKGGILAADIYQHVQALADADQRGKVDFHNIQDVKERTYNYFKACQQAEVFPSVMGLASHGYGISRQALNQYLRAHQGEEAAEFICRARDTIADILTNASLFNNANAAQVIFQLKNHFGHSDTPEPEPRAESHTGDRPEVWYRDAIRKLDPEANLTGKTREELQAAYIGIKYKTLLEPSPLEDYDTAGNAEAIQ